MVSLRRAALFGTPALAILGMAVGMRVGARRTSVAAVIRGAPRAKGSDAFAWQLVTILEDRGVRETVAARGITVRVRAGGREATWRGETNEDGVAEMRLDLPGVARGDALDVEVTAPDRVEPLAAGRVAWGAAEWDLPSGSPLVGAAKREGAIALDVAVLGERLVPGYPVTLAVRATAPGGAPLLGVGVDSEPENGLEVSPSHATTCASGWAYVHAAPAMQVATLALHAHAADGRAGEWYGALPVAAGGMSVSIEGAPHAGEAFALRVRAGVERAAYVEVDDEAGRAFAVATKLVAGPQGPEARVDVPGLVAGRKWVVASSEPRGAEALAGSARATPFVVSDAPSDPCTATADLALHPAAGFSRFVAIDGFAERAPREAARRQRGLGIALTSLSVGALVEMALVVDAFLRARRDVKRAASALGNADAQVVTPRANPVGLLVGLFAVALGFALLAGLLFLQL